MAQPISCAPPLLSRTTSSSIMSSLTNVSSTLPLPTSFLTWQWWNSSKSQTGYPIPTFSLPSIAYFDRMPPRRAPSTQWRDSSSEVLQSQSVSEQLDSSESSPIAGPSNPPSPPASTQPTQSSPNPTPSAASQWFWVGPQPSPQAIAEKTCEMICYLWFSSTLGAPKSSPHHVRSVRRSRTPHSPSEPPLGLSDASTAALQFTPSSQFVDFIQKILQTTQVSQSVIVLSLRYIYRLKEENNFANVRAGSEFRVAVVALMMANKFVDDNTYTNKTWSDVSGIDLKEINKMEREFLLGVDYRLYVNTDTYKAWVNLLKGLVSVKERDEQQWQYSRRHVDGVPLLAPTPRHSASIITCHQQRARSSSPLPSLKTSYPFTFVAPTSSNPFTPAPTSDQTTPCMSARPGAKRPAVAAFSPPSASLPGPPAKRPISLDMTTLQPTRGPASAGSSYPLSAFANLSINRSDAPTRLTPPRAKHPVEIPQTLAAPYSLEDRNVPTDPQNLYYYALASSPATAESDNRVRKALLRSYQPSYQHAPPSYLTPPPPTQPMYVQSASTSPVHPLAPFRYSHTHSSHSHPHYHYNANSNNTYPSLPPIRVQDQEADDRTPYGYQEYHQQPEAQATRVPVAPFANAGPPGVHWGSQQAAAPYILPHV